MNSVYFPAHVVLIIRRLVNVVSSLSISNQYLLHQQTPAKPDESPNSNNLTGSPGPMQPLDCLKNVEWPWWSVRRNWDMGLWKINTRREIRNSEMSPNSTIRLPNWFSNPDSWSWPHLLSLFQVEVNYPPPDSRPPPPKRPQREDHDKENRKSPPKDRVELPRREAKVKPPDIIHQLLVNPALYDPILTPRYPIVLCHGLYGFDSRGPTSFPSMRMHYWSNVLRILRGQVGAEVIVTSVPGTGSIQSRAARLDEQLQSHARGRGINFLAHSMGGLDCRHLISHIKPAEYAPLSLTSISTPHRGSPFMDWCAANIGIGKLRQQEKELAKTLPGNIPVQAIEEAFVPPLTSQHAPARPPSPGVSLSLSLSSLPSSFTSLLLSVVDSPAYANLTSNYLNAVFNPDTPDDPDVKYWSVAGRMSAESVSVWHPFWLPKMVLDGVEETEREKLKKLWDKSSDDQNWEDHNIPLWANEREWGNDGLVTVQSAKWGEFLGIMEGCDHWEMRGARGIEFGVDLPAFPAIGLGSVLPTSAKRIVNNTPPTDQGDGWGFGDWTRFVGAWMKSKSEAATRDKDETRTGSSQNHDRDDERASLSSSFPQRKTPSVKRAGERLADDDVVRSSTDKLSAVFDWLIERVPAPKRILGVGSTGSEGDVDKNERSEGEALPEPDAFESLEKQEKQVSNPRWDEKELNRLAASYTVSHGVGSSASTTSSSSSALTTRRSEIKRRMDSEKANLKKKPNELGSKDDLERFYVALTRKMYDEGL